MPVWRLVSIISLVLAGISLMIIVADLLRGRAQKMWVMDIVWPLTALWAGPLAVWAYFRYGRAGSKPEAMQADGAATSPRTRSSRFAFADGMAGGHVWLDGYRDVRHLQARATSEVRCSGS